MIKDIIKGHVNEITNTNSELMNKRMEICKKCPLYKMTSVGPLCNSALYMDPEGRVSAAPLSGYKRGCGCRLNAKTRLDRARCGHGR